ncbi:MAG: insulinase family protein [Blastocatellia bacterium]
MLSNILFAGESSRMYQRLVDKEQLNVFSINGRVQLALDPTLFAITAQPKEGGASENLVNTIYAELDKIKNSGVTERELQKARNALIWRSCRVENN